MKPDKFSDTTIIRGVRRYEARRRLIAAREGKGWTQQELARRTGWDFNKAADGQTLGALSQQRIANFEQGTRGIGFEAAESLARAFEDAGPSIWFMGLGTKRQAEHAAVEEGKQVRIFEPPEELRALTPLTREKKRGHKKP